MRQVSDSTRFDRVGFPQSRLGHLYKTMTDKDQTRTEQSDDERLLDKMRGILGKSVAWWDECVTAQKGKGLGASKDSAISAFQMIEKLEARISGKTHMSGNWRVVFAKAPELFTTEDAES